jgi:hypothetical protein
MVMSICPVVELGCLLIPNEGGTCAILANLVWVECLELAIAVYSFYDTGLLV